MEYHITNTGFSRFLVIVLVVCCVCLLPGVAQAAGPLGLQVAQSERQDAAAAAKWQAEQRRQAMLKENLKRQQEIKQDTAKLLELATELKQYVDKSNENMLSLDVLRKAEQIEKLAKEVREKMKGP